MPANPSRPLTLAALLLLTSRTAGAQLVCQFGRNYMLSAAARDAGQAPQRLAVAASLSYGLNSPNQLAMGGDVTYRLTRRVAVAGGVAYCDPRLGLDERPVFGAAASWTGPVSADSSWWLGVQAGASYVELDFGIPQRQKETIIPGFVAVGYAYERFSVYGGALVQYRHESFPDGSSESKGEFGVLLGLDLTLAARLALGVAYNQIRIEDPSGNHGFFNKGVLRLEYALGRF